jgi:hypothetical protein
MGLVLFLVGLLLLTGIAAGAYPALYISSFNPVEIFKGKQKLVGTNPLIRVLLTLQLALAMTVIIAAIVFARNAEFIETFDFGYSEDDVYMVRVSGEEQFGLLKTAVANHPGVARVGGSRHSVGEGWYTINAENEGNSTRINVFDVGEDYLETLGFTVRDGRPFDADLATDVLGAIIVNESLVRHYGWESIENKRMRFTYSDTIPEYRVVGTVRNFYPYGVGVRVRPTALRFVDRERYRFLVVRTGGEQPSETAASIEASWKELFPHQPFRGFWLEESFAEASQVNESIRLVFLYIAIMVTVISAMGLFALVSLNISRRTKEIGIRKALGASVAQICFLIAREFIVLLLVAGAIASAMGYYLSKALMGSIWVYYTGFSIEPFVLALVLVILVSAITVGIRVVSAAYANPVEALRYE